MKAPDGAVSGMCTASGLILTVGFTFFKEWAGYGEKWILQDLIVIVPFLKNS